jgi:hypothetical protein
MVCETCNALLAEYRRRVDVFVNEVLKTRDAIGPDATLTGKQADQMRLKSQAARHSLLEHWRKEHSSLAEAAKHLC